MKTGELWRLTYANGGQLTIKKTTQENMEPDNIYENEEEAVKAYKDRKKKEIEHNIKYRKGIIRDLRERIEEIPEEIKRAEQHIINEERLLKNLNNLKTVWDIEHRMNNLS